jgi:DNA repair ATPase RecN
MRGLLGTLPDEEKQNMSNLSNYANSISAAAAHLEGVAGDEYYADIMENISERELADIDDRLWSIVQMIDDLAEELEV